jgi:hypothetical protein|tara:strand:- start:400 stop:597 length:198 start_codon:yes stop_codon:yes gene_type:complete
MSFLVEGNNSTHEIMLKKITLRIIRKFFKSQPKASYKRFFTDEMNPEFWGRECEVHPQKVNRNNR